jgi:hypothetical protein
MTCTQIDEFLDDPASSRAATFPGWVDEHCRRCERCRSLLELLRSKAPVMPAVSDLESLVERTVHRPLEPVSPLPRARTFAMVFLGIFALLAVGGISLMGSAATRAMSAWQFVGMGSILGAGAVLLSISLSRQMRPGSYHRIRPGILALLLPSVCLLAYAGLFPWMIDSKFLTSGMRCASVGLLSAVPPGMCFWLVTRRGALLSPGVAGATAGLFSGLLGALILHFGCVLVQAPHLVLWHGAVPVMSAVFGFLLGQLSGRRKGVASHE